MSDRYDILVVGAGFAGSVMARELADRREARVLLIDRRPHIAGSAYDYYDEAGVQVHKYGPHIFHTNSVKIVDYLSQFTEWHPYEHRVLARVDGQLLPIPINRTTINRLYGLELTTDREVEAFLRSRAEPVERVETSEDVVVSKVGRDLYEKFFRGYTKKQWQRDPSELDASVCRRIPVRTNTDDRYFTDAFQNMPSAGYTVMFERLLDHPLIEVRTDTDYFEVEGEVEYDHLVWTGPIDRFFSNRFGALPYRSVEFEFQTQATSNGGFRQAAAQINEPSEDVPFTRTTEFRHMTVQRSHLASTIAVEHPRPEGDPCYPIPTADNRDIYRRYQSLAETVSAEVTFAGRLARYQYLNMDQVVGQALACADRLIARMNAVAGKTVAG